MMQGIWRDVKYVVVQKDNNTASCVSDADIALMGGPSELEQLEVAGRFPLVGGIGGHHDEFHSDPDRLFEGGDASFEEEASHMMTYDYG